MKVYAYGQSSTAITVTWMPEVEDPIYYSVTVNEFGPDGKLMKTEPGLPVLGGVAYFTGLTASTTYKYQWCGVQETDAGPVTNCLPELYPATTLHSGEGGPGGGQLIPPVINNLDPEPATIKQGNSINLAWSGPTIYYKFLVSETENGLPIQEGEIDIGDPGTSSGSWRAQTSPGARYVFQVKGGAGLGGDTYSDWGPAAAIVALPNLTSLRQFLLHSGVNPIGASVRSLMPPGNTLRRFMQL